MSLVLVALMESKSGTRLFCRYTTIQEPKP